ncbi:hypothetical protein [Succinivibrio dextrinosolvens]|uniref:hypothetical protein n=1 Tax=Succinivibrio dextrinosolvens TaxID=83771 RepID=UPI0019214FAA|nr:hypothetical protein [Succinivibrio dextrinosolvens]
MLSILRNKTYLKWILALLVIAGFAVAQFAALKGQANEQSTSAGVAQAAKDMNYRKVLSESNEAQAKTIKAADPSSNIDWKKDASLSKKLDSIENAYNDALAKAKAEVKANGTVSDATRSKGLKLASDYQAAAEDYAKFWEANNGPTRAKTTRALAKSIAANADMAFNDIDSDKIDAAKAASAEAKAAADEYLASVKGNLSDKEKGAIKSNIVPKLQTLSSDVTGLVSGITNLLDQVKSEAQSSMSVGGLTSCAQSAAQDGPAALLSPLSSLLSMVQGIGSDITGMISDLTSL